ncbi:unnamed protein product [Ilex paraguariensis]|uniref:Uncharacterized protein n=1 Tax=Ilex paraguariensis TaxID=185542 RepID=A0ABC8SSJ6_9AQUA
MATSVFMVCDHETNTNGSETPMPEMVKQSGRKKSKSNETTQKKQPQRGMGVAQLERLRMQEWKKMTQTTPQTPLHSMNLQNNVFLPSSFAGPSAMAGVPIQFAKYGGYGVMNGFGQSSLSQTLSLQRLGHGGFHGPVGGSSVSGLVSDQFELDPYGVGAPNSSFLVGNAVETSKELSSMPNIKGFSEHCGVCHKKKRMNGENLGCKGVRNMSAARSPINGCSFAGFNAETKQNKSEGSQDFFMKAFGQAGYADQNTGKELEVVAVHRKESLGGRGMFMEYEFLPGNGGRGTSFKELTSLGSESSSVNAAVGGGEASCVTATTSSTDVGLDASTSIDLSLKLSY